MSKSVENEETVNPTNPINSMKSDESNGTSDNASSRDKIKAEIAEILDMEDEVKEPIAEAPDTPTEEAVEETKPEESVSSEEAFTPDDALIERAIRAGLTLADAKAFTTKEAAERVLAVLEEKTTSTKGKKDDDSAEEPAGEMSLPEIDEAALDDLDPSIAELIKSQNAALKALSAEVSTLKKAGTTAEAKGFFETQYGALDEKVRSHVDAVKKTQLKQKFDLLEKGYKAAGEKVDRETIFKEAVSITLSDAMAKAAAEAKSAKVASRKGLVIAPPGGSSGKTTKVVGGGEYADIIAALQEKGFE
jgi:hypothetical protein